METIVLLIAIFLALVILYFKAKSLVDSVRGDSAKSCCDCGNCPNSCAIREFPNTAGDSL